MSCQEWREILHTHVDCHSRTVVGLSAPGSGRPRRAAFRRLLVFFPPSSHLHDLQRLMTDLLRQLHPPASHVIGLPKRQRTLFALSPFLPSAAPGCVTLIARSGARLRVGQVDCFRVRSHSGTTSVRLLRGPSPGSSTVRRPVALGWAVAGAVARSRRLRCGL